MKLSENKDSDIRFKFNPCAVPFIPSVAREQSDEVLSRFEVLRGDAGNEFWNHDKPILDGYGKISELDEDLYFNCLPRHMFDSNENETSEKQTCSVESMLEKKLSSWLHGDEIFAHSREGSSVDDESWSATPVSSASPPLNEDQDHSSTSYGSLPNNSHSSDPARVECPKQQSELSETRMDHLDTNDCSSDVMRYYSPFGTGVSTWLAGEKGTGKESLRSRKEKINGKLAEEMNKDLLTVGNIWNDVDSRKTLESAAICSWMRQMSQDNSENDLFTGAQLRDEVIDRSRLPLYEFSSSLDRNPWLSHAEKKMKSLTELGWAGQRVEQRNLSSAENDENPLPFSLESNQHYIPYCGNDKLDLMGKDQFIQNSRLKPNSSSHHLMQTRQNNVPWFDPDNPTMMSEPMVYLSQFGQDIANHSAFPVFYVSSPVSVNNPSTNTKQMYNPYVMPFGPQLPGFLNVDYRNSLPQFYPNVDPLAFNGLRMKNPAYLALNRHSGPALELHQQLDACYEQFRNLENERKKAEAEMARQHPGKDVTSDNTMTVPLMPPNPSRIDRLVVEVLREHARVTTLVSRMALLRGIEFQPSLLIAFEYWMDGAQKLQTCRKNEIINRKKYRVDIRGVAQKEKDVAALAEALSHLVVSTRRARTALWCALQLASVDLPQQCLKQADAVARRSVQAIGLDPKPKTDVDFEYDGPSELLKQDVGFADYECEFYDSDHDESKDEINQELFCDENEDDLDCEVFASGSQQEACYRESDYESFTEMGNDADGKVFLDSAVYTGQNQFESKETKSLSYNEEPGKESDYESSSTDAGKQIEVEVGNGSSAINGFCCVKSTVDLNWLFDKK